MKIVQKAISWYLKWQKQTHPIFIAPPPSSQTGPSPSGVTTPLNADWLEVCFGAWSKPLQQRFSQIARFILDVFSPLVWQKSCFTLPEYTDVEWTDQLINTVDIVIQHTITFFNRFSQGFWAREKAVARSCDSLNPQNIFRGNVSFCHEWMRSPSSETRDWETDVWRADRRSVDEKKHCQARKRDPYSGPERDKHTVKTLYTEHNCTWTWQPAHFNWI